MDYGTGKFNNKKKGNKNHDENGQKKKKMRSGIHQDENAEKKNEN